MIETINVTLEIELIDERVPQIFGDGWDFTIKKYTFKKVSDTRVEVQFSFSANLHIVEDGETVHELPSVHTDAYQEEEEKLDRVLDVLSLHMSCGIWIVPDSHRFTTATSRDGQRQSQKTINRKTSDELEDQLSFLDDKDINQPIIRALRHYRSFLNDNELGWKITKLWSIIETLYGYKAGGSLMSIVLKEEREDLYKKINSFSSLNNNQKAVLIDRLKSTQEKGIIEIISNRINIMNEEGTISDEEKAKMLKPWQKTRGKQSHGNIIPKRNQEELFSLFDMESFIETMLGNQLKPKILSFLVFEKDSLQDTVYKHYGKIVSKSRSILSLPIRSNNAGFYKKELKYYVKDKGSLILLVHCKNIQCLRNDEWQETTKENLPKSFKNIVEKLQEKING